MLLKFKNLIIIFIFLFQNYFIFSAPIQPNRQKNVRKNPTTTKTPPPKRTIPAQKKLTPNIRRNTTTTKNTPSNRRIAPTQKQSNQNGRKNTTPVRNTRTTQVQKRPNQNVRHNTISTTNKTYPNRQNVQQRRQNNVNRAPVSPPVSVPRVVRPDRKAYGVYLGVVNYGNALPKDPSRFFFRFYINGEVGNYKIVNAKNNFHAYVLHNRLQEGYLYEIYFFKNVIVNLTLVERLRVFVEGSVSQIFGNKIVINGKTYIYNPNLTNRIICEPGGAKIVKQKIAVGDFVNGIANKGALTNLFITYRRKKYHPFVNGEPGVKTLKNYIKTALSGLGTILYVLGGGWNYAFSMGGSPQSTTIGVPKSCIDFFQHRDSKYSYRKTQISNGAFIINPKKSYYPFNGYNEYYYAGFDCSSFVAWVLYNVLNTESGKKSLNVNSILVAKSYARWHYGTFTRQVSPPKSHKDSKFKPGNIISVCGHVWICLGTCKDGSILFIHSVPSCSISGSYAGGGVQLSAIGRNKKCDAYRLADFYMKKYYPEWYKRYRPLLCSYNKYFNTKHQNAGMFQWNLNGAGLLRDPNNYVNKYPHEILRDIFRG